MEPALRAAVRKRVARGHVQVQVFFKRAAGTGCRECHQRTAASLLAGSVSRRCRALRHRFEARSESGSARAGHDRNPAPDIACSRPDWHESLEAEVLAAAALGNR